MESREEHEMAIFHIEVQHIRRKVYEVEADDWRGAVEKASEDAERDNLETIGAMGIYDENFKPVDCS
jgi:hypothetical protein